MSNDTKQTHQLHDRWCNYMLSHGDRNSPCNCMVFVVDCLQYVETFIKLVCMDINDGNTERKRNCGDPNTPEGVAMGYLQNALSISKSYKEKQAHE